MDSERRQELRREAHDLDVTVWVGKRGVEGVVDELSGQLEDSRIVKVRFHRSAGKDVNALAEKLAERAGAELVETRGRTAVYC